MTFSCIIRSTDAAIFSGRAKSVTLPTVSGEVQVLSAHADAFIALIAGTVVVEAEDGSKQSFALRGGVFRMKDDVATLVA